MKEFILILSSVIMVWCSPSIAADQKSILIIQSYHPELEWTTQCELGIRSAVSPQAQTEIFYMDTKRVPQSQFQQRADAAWNKFLELKPDLVMLGDDNALELLGPRFATTTTPTIYFGINNNPRNYFDDKTIPANITGVLERLPLFPWLRHLSEIMPNLHKTLVLMDASPTTEAIIRGTFSDKTRRKVEGVTVEYFNTGSWEEWTSRVTQATEYDVIITPTFHALKKKDGSHIAVETVIEWTSANSPVPVFSHQDYTVGPAGFVGAYVIYGQAHGRLAGDIAVEILENGKSPTAIPTKMDRKGKFYFNQQQLDRFNLRLPKPIYTQAIFQ